MEGVFNCSFARIAAQNSVYDKNGKVLCNKLTCLQKLLLVFADNKEAIDVSQHTYDKRLPLTNGGVKTNQNIWSTVNSRLQD